MAKDLVSLSRRAAALLDKRVEAFVEPLLLECVGLIDQEIGRDGVDAVTARAGGLTHLAPPDAVGPFSVNPAVATPLARLAGYCQTSIARLVDPHLRVLVRNAYLPALRAEAARTRAVLPTGGFSLPVCGKVPAGQPTLSFEDTEEFDFAAHFGGDDVFMLRVKGVSMIDELIGPGDLVVLRRTPAAEPGDVVVAMVDGEPTLKKLKLDKDRETGEATLRLYPCNGSMPPVDFADDRDNIVGVKIGVVRSSRSKADARRGGRRPKR